MNREEIIRELNNVIKDEQGRSYDTFSTNVRAMAKDCLKFIEESTKEVNKETSDGYHTFGELYHHRAILFSVIVNSIPEKSWKSMLHHDGTMFDNDCFIVGIETPLGQATYHYKATKYWDLFKCREIPRAPEWDGHTPSQAIERIADVFIKNPDEAILSPWVKTSDRLPTEADADRKLNVFVWTHSGGHVVNYQRVIESPDFYPWWTPIMPPLEVEE